MSVRRFAPHLLFGAALLLALLLRLVDLAAVPLSSAEAGSAWAAWASAHGERAPSLAAPPSSAVLFGLQVLLFWFVGDQGEVVPRLAPALVGSFAVLLPWLLRRQLGTWAAGALAVLVACEAAWVAYSRTADGAVLASAGALLVLVCLIRRQAAALEGVGRAAAGWGLGAAAGTGWVVAAGPLGWDLLPPLALVAVLATPAERDRARPDTRQLGVAVAAALLVSTTALAQWRGPGAVSVSLSVWMESWVGTAAAAREPFQPVLASGQLSLLALGSAGLAWLWKSGGEERHYGLAARRWVLTLVAWALWGAAVVVRPGSGPEAWLVLSIPLMLTGASLAGAVLNRAFGRAGAPERPLAWRPLLGAGTVLALALLVVAAGARAPHRQALDASESGGPAGPEIALHSADLRGLLAPHLETPRRRLEVVAAPWPDPVLGWSLRGIEGVRWVPAASRRPGAPVELLTLTPARHEAELIDAEGALLGRYRQGPAPAPIHPGSPHEPIRRR